MIVECFGPPASGKTTLSIELASRLREHDFPVHLKLSSRPGEENFVRAGPRRHALLAPIDAALRRLLRPALELARVKMESLETETNNTCDDALAQMLARGNALRRLRIRQYLIRLASAWAQASAAPGVWLFDQGYMQLVATAMVRAPDVTDAGWLALLGTVPKSDLIVFVDTPVEEIESRFAQRQQLIGPIGRLFEADLGEAGNQAQAAWRLNELLVKSGMRIVAARSAKDLAPEIFSEGERLTNSSRLAFDAPIG